MLDCSCFPVEIMTSKGFRLFRITLMGGFVQAVCCNASLAWVVFNVSKKGFHLKPTTLAAGCFRCWSHRFRVIQAEDSRLSKNLMDFCRFDPVTSFERVSYPLRLPNTCQVTVLPDLPGDIKIAGSGPDGSRQLTLLLLPRVVGSEPSNDPRKDTFSCQMNNADIKARM